MNGARSTYMRRGFLLTALAAVVLLASSGTALAQNTTGVTITGPSNNTINEGGTATYTVAIRGYVGVATGPAANEANDPAPFNVVLTAPTVAGTGTATEGELEDLNANAHVLSVSFDPPRNTSQTNRLLFTDSKTISVATLHDNDAENEQFTLAFGFSTTPPAPTEVFRIAATEGTGSTDVIALVDITTPTPANTRYNPNALTIDDDETQGYTLALTPGQTTKPTEGAAFTVDLKASPAHEDGSGMLQVNIDKPTTGTPPPWTLALSNPGAIGAGNPTTVGAGAEGTTMVTIMQADGDGNRVTDTVTVSAHMGVAGNSREVASLSIDVADGDLLQAVTAKVVDKDGRVLATQPESLEEGKSVHIAMMPVDKDGKVTNANEKLTIALASSGSADARDFRLSAPIEITSGQNKSNVVMLTAETDEDVGVEMLVLDATVSGIPTEGTETRTSAGVLSLEITDATAKKIWPKDSEADYDKIKAAIAAGAGDDEMLNPGEMVTIMTDDLFGVMDGYTGSYSVSVEGGAVSASASGDTVNIEAMVAGESKVTVTGTARMSSSLESSQTVSNVASLTFPVTVVDMPLEVHLEMPDNVMDGNIVEGETYMIPVHANRMITEAEGSVEVMIMRDRAESDANDDDFTVSSATIMAGYDSATAELMVTEDMMDDSGHAMGEALVLYGEYGDGMETNSLMFTIWDTAVPALPLIAQILLALFLALGGARLYRRRQG